MEGRRASTGRLWVLAVLGIITVLNFALLLRKHRPSPAGEPPAPAITPQAMPPPGLEKMTPRAENEPRPWRTLFVLDLWEIHKERTRLEHRGRMEFLGGPGADTAFAPRSLQVDPTFVPREFRVSGNVRHVSNDVRDADTPFGRRRMFFPVLAPARPPKKGDVITYCVSYVTDRPDQLHVNGEERRLLSIKQEKPHDGVPMQFIIALPKPSIVHMLSDAQPYRKADLPGWTV